MKDDDSESEDVLAEFLDSLPVQRATAAGVGVVGSMNSCLRLCQANYIALVDDDVELPPEWIGYLLTHLNENPKAVAAGGRDLLMDHPKMRASEPLVDDVGRISCWGRVTGNHHRGGGKARKVDILRGSNCLYRGDFLRTVGFEKGLAGKGAQVNWEIALALQARQEGWTMIYDPQVQVIHYVAPRLDSDTVHRGLFHYQSIADIAHNETFVVLKHGRGFTRFMAILWQLVIGSQTCPGVLRLPQLLINSARPIVPRYSATLRGRILSLVTLLRGINHAG